jgi:SET domain-containing protein
MIADIVVRDAGEKGKGVFALRDFKRGEFIFRRRHGGIYRNVEIGQLSEEDQRHTCELDWETSAILLPPGCYLNHSCEPNAMRKGVNVYAWRDIRQAEEITIDYRLNAFSNELCVCACGSRSCPGFFYLSFFALSEEIQYQYLPYAPRFIRNEYRRRNGKQGLEIHSQ